MAGPDRPERIYLDASVWIAWINGDHNVEVVSRVMEWAAAKQAQLLVSPLHLVEVLGQRLSCPIDRAVDRRILDLLTAEDCTFIEFDFLVAKKARELRLSGVVTKARDSIHLAHAIVARAEVLFTVDQDDYPLGKTIEGVYVSKPYLLGDPDLFTPGEDT